MYATHKPFESISRYGCTRQGHSCMYAKDTRLERAEKGCARHGALNLKPLFCFGGQPDILGTQSFVRAVPYGWNLVKQQVLLIEAGAYGGAFSGLSLCTPTPQTGEALHRRPSPHQSNLVSSLFCCSTASARHSPEVGFY